MPSSDALRGYKGFVRIGRGETPTWTKLHGVPNFSQPEQTPGDIDTTHLESPDDTEEGIPGMKPLGAWTLELDYYPESDTDDVLESIAASGEIVQIELNWPTNRAATTFKQVVYAGYCKGYFITAVDPRNKITATAPFTIMGKVAA